MVFEAHCRLRCGAAARRPCALRRYWLRSQAVRPRKLPQRRPLLGLFLASRLLECQSRHRDWQHRLQWLSHSIPLAPFLRQ